MVKRCPRCGHTKDIEEFHKHKGHKDGHVWCCKLCVKETTKRDPAEDKHRARKRRLAQYGLNAKSHAFKYIEQNGCCVICGKSVSYDKMTTDHNHITGKVRALLCRRCNLLVGWIETSVSLIDRVKQYLGEWQ